MSARLRTSASSSRVPPRATRRRRPVRQDGMTLVELMIAMTIGLLLVAALASLVVSNSRAQAELDRSSRQIENGRLAIDLLTDELKLAGYFGEFAPLSAAYEVPDVCATAVGALGWSVTPIVVPAPVSGADVAGAVPACVPDHRPGTGAVAIRRVSTDAQAAGSVVAGNLYLQSTQCATDVTASRFVVSSDAGELTLRGRDCGDANPVRRYVARTYFVADCSDCGTDTIPTLKRLELRDGALVATPVAEGIEELQFEYGFDTNGDAVPDEFRTGLDGVVGSATNDWANVMAVRIHLLSRTTEETRGYRDTKVYDLGTFGTRGPFEDGFKRRAYSVVVRLPNPSGWRE